MCTQKKKKKAHKRNKKKTPKLDNGVHPIRTMSPSLAQQWGGLYIKWHERRELQSSTAYKRLIPPF